MKEIIFLLLLALVFTSCKNEEHKKVNRDKKYGGSIRLNLANKPVTFYTPGIKDISTAQLLGQIHAGLVKFNPKNLDIDPCIARKWTTNNDQTVFTFLIRKEARFQDDICFNGGKGRKIVASDVLFTLEQLCTQDQDNENFASINMIKGAKKYYDQSLKGKPEKSIEGIKVLNDSTIEITIEKSNPFFVNILANTACAIIPFEAIDKYGKGNQVGAGAFVMKNKIIDGKSLILSRNKNFFIKDKKDSLLPYIDTLQVVFIPASQKEIKMFFNRELDMLIGLQQSQIPEIMEKNMKGFTGKPPQFVLTSPEEEGTNIFNLILPTLKNFYTNRMNYLDFSSVYIEKEIPKE